MTITSYDIRNKIYTIRGLQVMLDADLAELYHVNTKALNQAVKRNINRFPSSFCFQLTLAEKEELVTTCDRLTRLKHSSVCPNVFTESGVAMLSAILRSDVAVNTSIAIMNAFISLRHYMTVLSFKIPRSFNYSCFSSSLSSELSLRRNSFISTSVS